MYVMPLEELKESRKNKNSYKSDFLGLKKVGGNYLNDLQDTAEYYAREAEARQWELIRIYKKLSKKLNNYLRTDEELEKMGSDTLSDYITDMLIDLCGYDE